MRLRLRRRGVDHGWVTPVPRDASWERAEPVVLRGVIPPCGAPPLRLVAALRRGVDLARLVRPPRGFRVAGVTQNVAEPTEIQKLHVEPGDLYVKVNWLSTHPGDGSLRLRFSYGAEVIDDWLDDPPRARATLRLAAAFFPECAGTLRSRALTSALRRLLGARPRFIQPIVYANAAGGGALFHHDCVPGQRAVAFTQLAGRTGWLALPQRELARYVGRGRRLDDRRVERLINHTPAFTRRLAADGWFFALGPGDALLLPSRGPNDTAWHSVFTLGRGGNLALSVGVAAYNRPE